MNARTECCAQCPYHRGTTKEYLDTRGQMGERFVGQAIGGFFLPCHMESGFKQYKDNPNDAPQCAGAAKFRANIGIADAMPQGLSKLPKDEAVFGSPEELIAHHRGVSVKDAASFLKHYPPALLAAIEHARKTKNIVAIKR